jgi:hypothetical protein
VCPFSVIVDPDVDYVVVADDTITLDPTLMTAADADNGT